MIPKLHSKRNENIHPDRNKYPMSTTASFITAKRQKQCTSMDEWINKLWYIHIMKYYSATKITKYGSISQLG